ncbi:energy transducer TonB [Paracrocinitomix mangrovi]|uniref:energy transducer TonB n=1 Tax=Paracrocinitomix mangrovi TaxID=2862509 RepID=UPI001C8ED09A|nr:energy transducer TonB [Paracrocinitomix mangrovi]UKN00818.1 energy transducer TonB [Paracrocinitomix mangrovi]
MRPELEKFEQIDQYLSGEMSADQAASFEAQMNADPALKSMVHDQQLLIQTVSRKAMMAEINAVAGLSGAASAAGSASWGLTQWIITSLSVLAVGTVGIFTYNYFTEDEVENTIETSEIAYDETENENHDTAEFMAFNLNLETEEERNLEDEDNDLNHVKKLPKTDPNEIPVNDPLNNFSFKKDIKTTDQNPDVNMQDVSDKEIGDRENESGLSKDIFTTQSRKASFPGTAIDRQKWFAENLVYPRTAYDEGIQGTVRITFLVETTGELTITGADCIAIKDEKGKLVERQWRYRKAIKALENRAVMTFRKSPKWLPATNTNGTPQMSEQVWYVNFVLNGQSSVYQLGDESGYLNEFDHFEDAESQPNRQLVFSKK